jgi:poly(A) polymerase
MSNKARKRLGCAASPDVPDNPWSLAYYVGIECAVDRLLLAGKTEAAAAIAQWHVPRLTVRGGQLIERGLAQGPEVARTLQAIERRWVDAGFPRGQELDVIVNEELAAAARS